MPFTLITSGKNKGKYRTPSGKIWSRAMKNAYLAKKRKKRA